MDLEGEKDAVTNDGSDNEPLSFDPNDPNNDFLQVTYEQNEYGKTVYYDKHGNELTDDQYDELYTRYMNSLDEEVRQSMYDYSAGVSLYIQMSGNNELNIDYAFLDQSITDINNILVKSKDIASEVHSLIVPRFFRDPDANLRFAKEKAKEAIGVGEYFEADVFLDIQLSKLRKLRELLKENDPYYDLMHDVYKLYSLDAFAEEGISYEELEKQIQELSDKIAKRINELYYTAARQYDMEVYDKEYRDGVFEALNTIDNYRKMAIEHQDDNYFYKVANLYKESLINDSVKLTPEQLAYYNDNKDKYEMKMKSFLEGCEETYNYNLEYRYDWPTDGSIVNKYSFLSPEERLATIEWADLNYTVCYNELLPYENDLKKYETNQMFLDNYNRLKKSPVTDPGYERRLVSTLDEYYDLLAQGTKDFDISDDLAIQLQQENDEIKRKYGYTSEEGEAGSKFVTWFVNNEEHYCALKPKLDYYTEVLFDCNYAEISSVPKAQREARINDLKAELESLKGKTDEESINRVTEIEAELVALYAREDFLVKRQQYKYNKLIDEYADEYNKIVQSGREKAINDRIAELEEIITIYGSSEDEGHQKLVSDARKEKKELEEEKAEINRKKQELDDAIMKANDLILLSNQGLSDYTYNNKCVVDHYEIRGNSCIYFDKDGNEINPSEEEIAIYFAKNGGYDAINDRIAELDDLLTRYGTSEDETHQRIWKEAAQEKKVLEHAKRDIYSFKYLNNWAVRTDCLNYVDNVCGKEMFESLYKNSITFGNKVEGMRMANEWLNDVSGGGKILANDRITLLGLKHGLERFFEGFSNLLGGADGVLSPKDYALMYFSGLIVEKYGDDDLGKVYGDYLNIKYNVSSSTGNMIPVVAIQVIGYACPPLKPIASIMATTAMGMSVWGNTMEQGMQKGLFKDEAALYGFLTGLSEALLEKVMGGIPGFSYLDELAEQAGGISRLLINGAGEFGEEAFQSVLDPFLLYLSSGIWEGVDWNEVFTEGMYGLLTSLYMSGLGDGLSSAEKGVSIISSKLLTGNSYALGAVLNNHRNDADLFNENTLYDLSLLKNASGSFDTIQKQLASDPMMKSQYEAYLQQNPDSPKISYEDFVLQATVNHILEFSNNNDSVKALTIKIEEKTEQLKSIQNQIDNTTDYNLKAQLSKQLATVGQEIVALRADVSNMVIGLSFDPNIITAILNDYINDPNGFGYINEFGEIVREKPLNECTVDEIVDMLKSNPNLDLSSLSLEVKQDIFKQFSIGELTDMLKANPNLDLSGLPKRTVNYLLTQLSVDEIIVRLKANPNLDLSAFSAEERQNIFRQLSVDEVIDILKANPNLDLSAFSAEEIQNIFKQLSVDEVIDILKANPNLDLSALSLEDKKNIFKQLSTDEIIDLLHANPNLDLSGVSEKTKYLLSQLTISEIMIRLKMNPDLDLRNLSFEDKLAIFNLVSVDGKQLMFATSFTSSEIYDIFVGTDTWKTKVFEGLNRGNAYKYIRVNPDGKVDLAWGGNGGYVVGTIKSLDTLHGDVVVSRVGRTSGSCWGIHLDIDPANINTQAAADKIANVTMDQRAILNGESVMKGDTESYKAVLHVDKYNDTIKILSGLEKGLSDATVEQQLMVYGYSKEHAGFLIQDYRVMAMNATGGHPEWSDIKGALKTQGNSQNVTGTYGTTARWADLPGGATQMTTKLSAEIMFRTGIMDKAADNIPIKSK